MDISRRELGVGLYLRFDYHKKCLVVERKVEIFPGTRILEVAWKEVQSFSNPCVWDESPHNKVAEKNDELMQEIAWFWIDISGLDTMQA